MEKYKLITEILKINLDVENVGGFGVKTTKKEGNLEAKFTIKLMCPEFTKSMEKVKSPAVILETNLDVENAG